MKRLLVLCGGQSPEHVISLRSAKNILEHLDKSSYEVLLVGITKNGEWVYLNELPSKEVTMESGSALSIVPGKKDFLLDGDLTLGQIDIVFPVLHGPNGEDGTIQGLLSLLNTPFVGPGVLGSAVSMDKDIAKRLFKDAGLGVANWQLLTKQAAIPDFQSIISQLGSTVFIKPANMGSSVGVSRVENEKDWEEALNLAFKHDHRVLVEKSIDGRELECAVLGNEYPVASGVGEVLSGGFYSYEEKYDSDSNAEVLIPAKGIEEWEASLKETAISAYQALNCQGLARVDMFLTNEGEILVNEVNTLPGFTSISMYPKLWEYEGLSYSALLDKLIDLALSKTS